MKMAARQGMLAQRISLLANRLMYASGGEDLTTLRQELSDLVEQVQRSHRALVHGDTARNLPGLKLHRAAAHLLSSSPPTRHQSKGLCNEGEAADRSCEKFGCHEYGGF